MRNLGLLILAALIVIAGCGTAPQAASLPLVLLDTHYSPALLFNRDPAVPPAAQFACRSAWPAIGSHNRPGERVFYREFFHDRQGPGHSGRDLAYRRFDTYREGYVGP